MSDELTPDEKSNHDRVHLVRDAVVFQGKLLIDGVRDLLLVPISLIATIIDLFSKEKPKGRRFYEVVHLGKRSEHWIDLFGAAEKSPFNSPFPDSDDHKNLDDIVHQVESAVRQQYAEGGVSGSARKALDTAVDALHKYRDKRASANDDDRPSS